MKKNNYLFHITLSLLAVLLAGCSNDDKQIRAAAQGYLDAMGNYRPADARPYATEETCNVTLAFFEMLMQHTDPSVYANNIPATITLGDITIAEDTLATVAFHKHTPSKEQDGEVTLVCRDGQWRVRASGDRGSRHVERRRIAPHFLQGADRRDAPQRAAGPVGDFRGATAPPRC